MASFLRPTSALNLYPALTVKTFIVGGGNFRMGFNPAAGHRSDGTGETEDMVPDRQLVTELLQEWSSGNKQALDELMPVVYEQLRKLASNCLRSEQPDHTLRATALVHEAYMRWWAPSAWQDRVHFFAVSARILRRILVDHAKSNNRQKRGGDVRKNSSG